MNAKEKADLIAQEFAYDRYLDQEYSGEAVNALSERIYQAIVEAKTSQDLHEAEDFLQWMADHEATLRFTKTEMRPGFPVLKTTLSTGSGDQRKVAEHFLDLASVGPYRMNAILYSIFHTARSIEELKAR